MQIAEYKKEYQQNSNLHGGVQVMCMHPWFFSIGRLHLGQGLELANILIMTKSAWGLPKHSHFNTKNTTKNDTHKVKD